MAQVKTCHRKDTIQILGAELDYDSNSQYEIWKNGPALLNVTLRQNGVGTGFIGANAILPKGHG